MTEQELYNYYYNYFIQDLDKALNDKKVIGRMYVGGSSKKADKLVGELPKDQQSRDIMKRAAEDALKNKGYSAGRTWTANPFLFRGKYGNSAAKATLDKFANEKDSDNRTALVDPNAISQNPIQLAQNIINAMQNGQDISVYTALIPEDADELFKSAFIYTIASSYPAKTPEIAKEMQLLAKRHKLNYDKYNITHQNRLSWQDKATLQQE